MQHFLRLVMLCNKVKLMKTKWQKTKYILTTEISYLELGLGLYTSKFQNILVIVDLKTSMEDNNRKNFCESYNLKILIKFLT